MALLNLNRIELDNLRRVAQGFPHPFIGGGSQKTSDDEYYFYLRNNSDEDVPANTTISAALVWDVGEWYISFEDEVYAGTSGLFGTPWSSVWSPDNSVYDRLLYTVLDQHTCYLRFHDWFASPGQHGIPAWLEETWGNMHSRPNMATGLGTTTWGWSKAHPGMAAGRFYAKESIPAGSQGQIYFCDDVRPCYYCQADVSNSSTINGEYNPIRVRNTKTQHSLRGTRWGARYIPRFMRDGVVMQSWKFPDGQFTGSASMGPRTSYTSWIQTNCEDNIGYGLSNQLLVASIPSPIAENVGGSGGTSSYTDVSDFWQREVMINGSRIVYNDPYLWDGYRGASQSTSNKEFPARCLGLACPCSYFTSPTWGFRLDRSLGSQNGWEGINRIYRPSATAGYMGSFCCGAPGECVSMLHMPDGWSQTSSSTLEVYFHALTSPTSNGFIVPNTFTRMDFVPLYSSTRWIEKIDDTADSTTYMPGTLLDSYLSVTTSAAGDAVWVVCYPMGSTGGGSSWCFDDLGDNHQHIPMVIKSVNDQYKIF